MYNITRSRLYYGFTNQKNRASQSIYILSRIPLCSLVKSISMFKEEWVYSSVYTMFTLHELQPPLGTANKYTLVCSFLILKALTLHMQSDAKPSKIKTHRKKIIHFIINFLISYTSSVIENQKLYVKPRGGTPSPPVSLCKLYSVNRAVE
jgi:hypothetical protein